MRRNEIHERRGQAVIRLKPQFPEPRTHGILVLRVSAGLNDRRHEGRETRCRPAGLR
jgi:hypothetical protein